MRLYHFTATSLAASILSDAIRLGHLVTHTDEIAHGVVWLTSYPYPDKTGVPMKETRLSSKQLAHASRVENRSLGNNLSHDKSRIRLGLDSNSLKSFEIVDNKPTGLISFEKWCKLVGAPKNWAKYIGMSACFDLENMTDEEKVRQMKKKGNTQESTWYLHFGPIAAKLLDAVDCKVGKDYVPFDFEKHGRNDLSYVGIECVSPTSLAELRKIVEPWSSLEMVYAAVFCEGPSARPEVTVRGGGVTCHIDIETGEVRQYINSRDDYPLSEVRGWIERHKAELSQCWDSALTAYYRYYPEEAPQDA